MKDLVLACLHGCMHESSLQVPMENTLNAMTARVGARHSHDCNGVHDAIGVARDTINAIAGGVGDTFKSSSGLFSSISLIPEDKPGSIDVGVVSNVNDTGGGNDNNFVSNTVM
jgi:hypothetical protein